MGSMGCATDCPSGNTKVLALIVSSSHEPRTPSTSSEHTFEPATTTISVAETGTWVCPRMETRVWRSGTDRAGKCGKQLNQAA